MLEDVVQGLAKSPTLDLSVGMAWSKLDFKTSLSITCSGAHEEKQDLGEEMGLIGLSQERR